MTFSLNKKFLKAYDLLLLVLLKHLTLGMPCADPFLVQVGPKSNTSFGFNFFFFRTTRLQHQSLILIEYPNISH